MSDRIQRVSIDKFDQVIGLTQYLINSALDNVWTTAHQDGDKAHDIIRRDQSGMTQVVLGAPTILVAPKEGDRSLVYYNVHIKSGTLKLYLSSDQRDNSTCNYQMKDWRFVFPVNIGLTALTPGSQKYNDVRAKINKPGDYSIRQLLILMKTAQFAVPDEQQSFFGTWSAADYVTDNTGAKQTPPGFKLNEKRDWFSQPERVQKSFTTFLQDLTDLLLDNGMDDLGYTASTTTPQATGHDPTFTPTDVRFQTYPWIDPSSKTAAPIDIKFPGALNYLLYLEMTDNHTPPDPNSPDAFLPTSGGNWTDGRDPNKDSPSSFGSMVIASRNFLYTFFLPKLNKINRLMIADITYIKPMIQQTAAAFAYRYCFSWTLQIGTGVSDYNRPDPADGMYAFGPSGSKDFPSEVFPALPAGALEWTYIYLPAKRPEDYDSSGIAGSKSYMYTDCQAYNWIRLHIIPGTNEVVLQGLSRIRLKWEVNPSRLDPNFGKEMNTSTNWKITFTLKEVSDGGLVIEIKRDGPTTTVNGNIWNDGSTDGDIVRNIYTTAGNNLDHVLAGLDNALKGQERFFFPSKGTFFIKDPVFTHNGDLIAGLEYNSVDNAAHPNTKAKARQDLTLVPSGNFRELQKSEHQPQPVHS